MIKFITCLFLVCGLAAEAAVYSNEFTANPNPAARLVVTNVARAELINSNANWVNHTNGIALTPSFYGKIGIGLPSASAATAVELRDGTTDQAILFTRELNTSATSLGFRTGASYEWQLGQRNGDSDLWLVNAINGSHFNFDYAGPFNMFISPTAGFQDNGIGIINKSGGYSSIALYDPKGSIYHPQNAAAVTLGFGPGELGAGAYGGRAYIGLNASNAIGLPPELVIAQEQTNSAGIAKAHIRQHFTSAGAIKFYNYNDSFETGTVALAIGPEGNTTLGAAQGTNTTLIPGITALGPNTNVVCIISNSSATGPGVAHWFRTTNGVLVFPAYQSVNLTNGNVGFGTATPPELFNVSTNIFGRANGEFAFGGAYAARADKPMFYQTGAGARYVLGRDDKSGSVEVFDWAINNSNIRFLGSVGIGTATPANKLDVIGTISSIELKPTNGIVGITNATDAAGGTNGFVGQFTNVLLATGSAIALPANNVTTNTISFTLTAGDWDVDANCNFNTSAATITGYFAGISTNSLTLPTDGSECYSGAAVTLFTTSETVTVPRKRINVSAPMTVYLVSKVAFSAGSVTTYGGMTARRVR